MYESLLNKNKNKNHTRWSKQLLTLVTALGLTICFSPVVEAANWFKLRGTEPGGIAHTLQVWFFYNRPILLIVQMRLMVFLLGHKY